MQGSYFPYFMKEAFRDAERESGDSLGALRDACLRRKSLSRRNSRAFTRAAAALAGRKRRAGAERPRTDGRVWIPVSIALSSGALVAAALFAYVAAGGDPKIGPSSAYLGIMIGAVYGITAVYLSLAKAPERRVRRAVLFLVISVLVAVLFLSMGL